MSDTEPMKCAFARVLNDLAPGKYYLTNVDSLQILRIEVREGDKCNYLEDGMFMLPYDHVEPADSPSANAVCFLGKLAGHDIMTAILNLLGGWTIAKVGE